MQRQLRHVKCHPYKDIRKFNYSRILNLIRPVGKRPRIRPLGNIAGVCGNGLTCIPGPELARMDQTLLREYI